MFNTHYTAIFENLIRSDQLLLAFSKEPIDLHNEPTKDLRCLLTKSVSTALPCLTKAWNVCTANPTHKAYLDDSRLAKIVGLTTVPWGIRDLTRSTSLALLIFFFFLI